MGLDTEDVGGEVLFGRILVPDPTNAPHCMHGLAREAAGLTIGQVNCGCPVFCVND
jgi:hypothetical protein